MKKSSLSIFFILFHLAVFAQKMNSYPISPQDSVVDTYFKTGIADPYQWMENPDDPRLIEWLEVQNKITRKNGSQQINIRELKAQIWSLYNNIDRTKRDSYVQKEHESKYEFEYEYKRYDRFPDLLYRLRGKGNFNTLVKSKNFKLGKEDNIAITKRYVNEDHDLMAVEMCHNGSDWREVYFFDLISGQQLPDTLKYVRGSSSVVWDQKNVYYDGYEKPKKGRDLLDKAKGQKLYYHKFGTSQALDSVLYQNPDTTGTNSFHYGKTDEKLLFYHFFNHNGEILRALSISNTGPEAFFLKNFLIYPNRDSIRLTIEEIIGDSIILKTNWNAPNGRVLLANSNELNKVYEMIPEYDVTLREVNRLGKDKIACIYRYEGQNLVLIYNTKGVLISKLNFPEGKKVKYFYEQNEEAEYTDFSVSSFYHPDIFYQLSLKNLTFQPSTSLLCLTIIMLWKPDILSILQKTEPRYRCILPVPKTLSWMAKTQH